MRARYALITPIEQAEKTSSEIFCSSFASFSANLTAATISVEVKEGAAEEEKRTESLHHPREIVKKKKNWESFCQNI
jgi:hypothetical protein